LTAAHDQRETYFLAGREDALPWGAIPPIVSQEVACLLQFAEVERLRLRGHREHRYSGSCRLTDAGFIGTPSMLRW
jgi:hypothetical protein